MFSTSTNTTRDHYSNSMGINIRPLLMERATTTKWKYNNIEMAPNCPRCASSNTKFCYYNNYSLSQPRYFCKGCRRYWTKGGSLRNVPVGGGCRKSRRSRAARHQPGGPGAHAYADPADAPHGGACIDMAAVFAKYVDQSQHAENVENVENEESFSSGSFDVDSQLIGVGDDQVQQAMPQLSTCQDVSGQQFAYQGCGGFELQQQGVVLCDELSPDMLWSEGTSLESYGYHHQQQLPMVQVEDCGLFAPDHDDDQLRISANLVSENWGSFDLSAYDFYSTP